MDFALLRSFLEVAATGSFVAASERLFVTQSAVSLRIRRLEGEVGEPLFTRSKAGAMLTPAGQAFEPYARRLLATWEEGRQQVALPEVFARSVTIGAQPSLWPRLGFRWIDALRAGAPEVAVRAVASEPEEITRQLGTGLMQAALLYAPRLRPGLTARAVLEEELVLVSTRSGDAADALGARYVLSDWGPEFAAAHAAALPGLSRQGVTLALGALATEYLLRRDAAAYLPARYVARNLEAGTLHPVEGAPVFALPVFAVARDDLDDQEEALLEAALEAALVAVQELQDAVLDGIEEIGGTAPKPIMT